MLYQYRSQSGSGALDARTTAGAVAILPALRLPL
jgi:hypothetical protein